jgi:hypothetical protein
LKREPLKADGLMKMLIGYQGLLKIRVCINMATHNNALDRTFTTLRFVHAAQLCRYWAVERNS